MNKFVIDSNQPDIKSVAEKIKINDYLKHNKEQIIFRIFCCKKCILEKKCQSCNCNPLDKILEPVSCNKKIFPNILNKDAWDSFKKEHNIKII